MYNDKVRILVISITVIFILVGLYMNLARPAGIPVGDDIKAEYITIDGMTCLHYHNVVLEVAVLSCDWEQWDDPGPGR